MCSCLLSVALCLSKQVQSQDWKQTRVSWGLGAAHIRILAAVRGNCRIEGLGAKWLGWKPRERLTAHLHLRMGGVRAQRWGPREVTTAAAGPVWQLGGWGRGQISALGISNHWAPLGSRGSGCHHGKGEATWRPLPSYSHVRMPQKDLSVLQLSSPKFLKA